MFLTEIIMSMDYPDYELIQTKSRKLAFIWMLGDRLYYIGLLGAMFIVIATPVSAFFTRLKGSQVGPNLWNYIGLGAFIFCIVAFLVAPHLKHYARTKAEIKE